ncbi:hypothetical protein [Variovorax paradoxus]|uniref:hypothetical protein n=1 Tax=Variovorax paradoxus TaxID=34073 RepID=UPI0029C7D3EA|nr:hypothetical protein [Variovorax paradoxus]WPH22311.1 hypothetical protein RZE78_09135 [Variovorax paradoxus]
MAFRADEAVASGNAEAVEYFVGRLQDVEEEQRQASRHALLDIIDRIGPAVDGYPSWHPLVSKHDDQHPETTPSRESGYEGLDHTRYFVHGFISCPYGDGADKIIESVERLMWHAEPAALITARKLDVPLYSKHATPVLVECEWQRPLGHGRQIPMSLAVALMLQKEVPCWHWSKVAETWESMRPYFLGAPRGSRSSLFVSQDTGQAMKKVWESVINSGMFGPIKVDRGR